MVGPGVGARAIRCGLRPCLPMRINLPAIVNSVH